MDPITLIVSALAAGAVAGVKSTASSVVKDSYDGFKKIIKKKFGTKVSVEEIEKNPNSEAKRASVTEDLKLVNAENDTELLIEAKKLFEIIKQHAPGTKVTGINIEEVEAAFIKISEVISAGDGVKITKAKIQGGIEISKVSAGTSSNPN